MIKGSLRSVGGWHVSRMAILKGYLQAFVLLALAVGGVQAARAQAWQARYDMSPAAFQAAIDELSAQGYVPVEISGIHQDGATRYAASWVREPEVAWQAAFGLSSTQMKARMQALADKGFVPSVLSMHSEGAAARYHAVWRRQAGVAWQVQYDMGPTEFGKASVELTDQGYVPAAVTGYQIDGQPRYGALWKRRRDVAWELRRDMTREQMQWNFDQLSPQGYVPVDISAYPLDGETRFAAIWERLSGYDWNARRDLDAENNIAHAEEQGELGYAPYVIAPYLEDGELMFAGAWRRMAQAQWVADAAAEQGPDTVPASVGSRLLAIAPVRQQTQVWCWLAVGEMLFRHYGVANVNPAGNFQCGIIGAISHSGSPCASNCFACVMPSGSNHGTLAMLTNYARVVAGRSVSYSEGGAISPAAVIENIDAGRPVMAGTSNTLRIANSDAEHVTLIVGYEYAQGDLWLVVNDPFPYPPGKNPFLANGGEAVTANRYRIPYRNFRDGVFWHWSVFNLSM